ncbi:MAG TPA: ribose-5-phosphate isomerase RpiA [Polyangia bacterium]
MGSDLAAEKRDAARRSVELIENDMVVGLGSGTTAAIVVEVIGERIKSGLRIRAISSSSETARLAKAAGIALIDFEMVEAIDLTIDGADEIDPEGRMIKGRGGALLYEKILASTSRKLVIAADSTKSVARLGGRCPVPVEVIPLATPIVTRTLKAMARSVRLRLNADGVPCVTDEGNHILDCDFGLIAAPEELAARLDGMVGVVEHGLFIGFAPKLIVGRAD